jgi:hypothetical protein
MKRLGVLLAACIAGGAAVAAFVIPWSGSAAASTSWTSVGSPTFTDTKTGTVMSCSASAASMSPAGSRTNPVGEITAISFTGCSSADGITLTITPEGLDWPVSADPSVRTIGETSGGHGVAIELSGPGCQAYVDGTGVNTNTGVVHFTFGHVTGGPGIVVSDGNLHIYKPSGCFGLVGNGDPVSFKVSYRVG